MSKTSSKCAPFVDSSIESLKGAGFRITTPRVAVLECLVSTKDPVTARDIFEKISNDSSAPDIDQVSVYRVLETLLGLGIVHQVFPSGGYLPCLHSGCSSKFHVLMRCLKCEKTEEVDVPESSVMPIVHYLKSEQSFEPEGHVFQMNGVCKKCK